MGLGADEFIDYNTRNFEEIITDADLVHDVVWRNDESHLTRSLNAIKPGGTLLSLMVFPSSGFVENDDAHSILPARMIFATTEQRTGLLIEYRLTRKLVFSLSGGLNSTLQSRVFEVGKRQSDYLISNKTGAMPYAQVGLSMLPFWTPFKR